MSEQDESAGRLQAGAAKVADESVGPEPSVEEYLQDLQFKLEEQTSEAKKYQDLYLRERADLENFKRRMLREKAEALRFAVEPLVRDLLAVVDNLERAVSHAGEGETLVVEGVRLVLKSLYEVLERHGITRIDATGKPFDPAHHEAIARVDSPDHEPNQVVAQHQSGFLLHDRLLRPAMVSVCGRKSAPSVESPQNRD